MSEERLVELETRVAYQDETLRVLSDALARQQQQLESLNALCLQMLERLREQGSADGRNPPVDEIPPHY